MKSLTSSFSNARLFYFRKQRCPKTNIFLGNRGGEMKPRIILSLLFLFLILFSAKPGETSLQFSPQCRSLFLQIRPCTQHFGGSGGNGSLILSEDGFWWTGSWASSSSDAWILITSPTSGIGSGVINFEVLPNTTGSLRIGAIELTGFFSLAILVPS